MGMKEIILITLLGPSAVVAQVPAGSEWARILARRRATHLNRLHEYTMHQGYPTNTSHDKLTPYFMSGGVPCAMGALVISSGHRIMAQKIAAENNHVLIKNLKDGPLVDWILSSGLLQEEAARVQPQYRRPQPGDKERRERSLAERKRVQEHLLGAERQLRANTEASLVEAERRLVARVEKDPKFGAAVLEEARREEEEMARAARWDMDRKSLELEKREREERLIKFQSDP